MTTHNETRTGTAVSLVAGVRFFDIGKVYHFSCDHLPDLLVGDYVVVETTRGRQLGQIMNLFTPDQEDDGRDYKPILRRATPTDMMSQRLWQARELEALITCRERAAEYPEYANAKFVAAQYNFDGTLLTFLFSAEDKINTTKLRAALQRSFQAKIELRQVGPRDVAKLLGGMGACGIPRCCSTFLTDFSPISIKMAKAQGISLNPSEITGMCGRLRCCLIYEYEQYVEARKILPKRNKRVGTPHGEGRVVDVLPLRDAVIVAVEDTHHVVQREDLVPIEEWEALKAKAEAGCAKNEGGECECGSADKKARSLTAAVGGLEYTDPDQDIDLDPDDANDEYRADGADYRPPITASTQVDQPGTAADQLPDSPPKRRGSSRRRGRSRRGKNKPSSEQG